MTVYDIKNKANDIMISSKDILFKVFVVMGVVTTIASSINGMLSGSIASIIGIAIIILLLPFGHGFIVASLKAVNNRSDEISIEEDGFVGFRRFKELFGTYFIYNFFMFILLFLIALVGMVFAIMMVPDLSMIDFLALYATTALINIAIEATGVLFIIMLPLIFIAAFVTIMYSLWFGLTPYLLERKGLRGTAAMKESMRLMKGYKWLLFKVELSFIGWIILCGIITSIIGMLLPIPLIVNLIGVVVAVFFYESKLQVCHAIVFEEILIEQDKGQTVSE